MWSSSQKIWNLASEIKNISFYIVKFFARFSLNGTQNILHFFINSIWMNYRLQAGFLHFMNTSVQKNVKDWLTGGKRKHFQKRGNGLVVASLYSLLIMSNSKLIWKCKVNICHCGILEGQNKTSTAKQVLGNCERMVFASFVGNFILVVNLYNVLVYCC